MSKERPVLDRTKDYAEIMHGDTAGIEIRNLPRYQQNGHYFKPDGSYHSADGLKPVTLKPAVVSPALVDTKPGVDESEVDELLKDPAAEELLALTRDHLIELVQAANGPMVSGENSTKMMVAWLIKNTRNDEL